VDVLYRQSIRWDRKAIHGVANMGFFSSDRSIAEYAEEIWNAKPIRF
jgi:starch phosphorylase